MLQNDITLFHFMSHICITLHRTASCLHLAQIHISLKKVVFIFNTFKEKAIPHVRKMPDYQKSKIYKIVCNVTGLVYIGSTAHCLLYFLQTWHHTHVRHNLWSNSWCKANDWLLWFSERRESCRDFVVVEFRWENLYFYFPFVTSHVKLLHGFWKPLLFV